MPESDEQAPPTDEQDDSEEATSPDSEESDRGAPGNQKSSSPSRRAAKAKSGLADRATEQAAKFAGPEAAAAVKTVNKLERKSKTLRTIIRVARVVGALGPVGTTLLVVGLVILFLIIIIMAASSGGAGQHSQGGPQLTLNKSGPAEAQNGQELNYQITVSYPGQATEIVVTDQIPDGTQFISSAQKTTCDNGECSQSSKIVKWNLKDIVPVENNILTNVNSTLTLKLRATTDNAFLVNRAEGSVTAYTPPKQPGGDGGGPPSEGYVAPSSNDCGKYDFSKYPEKNPLGNYGDPQCNFSKDNLYTLLKAKEPMPELVDIWFNMIVPVESAGYKPNAFAPPSDPVQCSLDCAGAWGLYQMGSSTPPGQPPPAPGKNGPFDRGDVNWEIQTTMAIGYNRELLGCNLKYWASARSVWGKYSC